jgi:hypothetical protein
MDQRRHLTYEVPWKLQLSPQTWLRGHVCLFGHREQPELAQGQHGEEPPRRDSLRRSTIDLPEATVRQ